MTGTNTYAAADFAGVFPEIWSSFMNWQYESKLFAAKFFLDLSADIANGGDVINIPDLFTNVFSASDKSVGSEVTLLSPASQSAALTVNTWKETSFLIEDMQAAAILKSQNLQKGLAEKASYTVAKAFDSSLLALATGLATIVNDSASDVTDPDIRNALAQMDEDDVPSEDRGFFFHPNVVWQDLFGIAKYYDAATLGLSRGPVVTGQIPSLYDVPIYKTTNVDATLTSYQNMLVHKTAFAFAVASLGNANGNSGAPVETATGQFDGQIRIQSNYIPENLGALTTADVIYGVAENRDVAGIWIKSRKTGFVS